MKDWQELSQLRYGEGISQMRRAFDAETFWLECCSSRDFYKSSIE